MVITVIDVINAVTIFETEFFINILGCVGSTGDFRQQLMLRLIARQLTLFGAFEAELLFGAGRVRGYVVNRRLGLNHHRPPK